MTLSRLWFNPVAHGVSWSHALRINAKEAAILRKEGDRALGGCEVKPSKHGGFYVYTNDPEAIELILLNAAH